MNARLSFKITHGWLAALLTAATVAWHSTAPAQTFTVLHSFTNASGEGWNPETGLTLAGDTLYGTTSYGTGRLESVVYRLKPDGTGFGVVWKMQNCENGIHPSGLTLSGGALYGTANDCTCATGGMLFQVETNGSTFTVLDYFTNRATGAFPAVWAGLIRSGGRFYGTTYYGGVADKGVVFKVDTDGANYTVIHHFTGATNDGAYPNGGLVLSGSTLYGTTYYGGQSNLGTVFSVTTAGQDFAVLKSFSGSVPLPNTNTDGSLPRGALVLSGSTLYGATEKGGYAGIANGYGTIFRLETNGTGYVMLHQFNGTDGYLPYNGVTLSGDTLYGTTFHGGSLGEGTVFKVKTDGQGFRRLWSFTSGFDGNQPEGALVVSGRAIYGTALSAGTGSGGVVFRIDLPAPISLNCQVLSDQMVLSWTNASFSLQSAPAVTGTYTNIPGATSPYTNSLTGQQRFFRLVWN